MSTKVKECFVDEMLGFFESPTLNPSLFFSALNDDLDRYPAEVLRAAARHFRTTREFKTFPSVAECIKVCNKLPRNGSDRHDEVDGSRAKWLSNVDQFGVRRYTPPSYTARSKAEAERLARRIPRYLAAQRVRNTGPLAEQAMQEGWLHGMIDFVEATGRMPEVREQEKLRYLASAIHENLANLAEVAPVKPVKGWATLGGAGMVGSLAQMRTRMLAQAKREVFGTERASS